jgi:hypothetical protein
VPRDRRWDFLYDRQRQPVKAYVVERLGEELAQDLSTWPPPAGDFVDDALQARWASALAARPRDAVLRLALEAARLELARDWDGAERRIEEERERLAPGDEDAARLLVRFLTEKCLAFQEWAEGARLGRGDLGEALRAAERRLFRVTA